MNISKLTKQDILLHSLYKYYNKELNMKYFTEVLNDKSCLSLRLIDWFVTKYSKSNNIEYIWNDYTFNVFNSYKSELKAYSKKQMDPFCRRERIYLNSNGISITTTCGQMNFFKWAIENGILNYVINNYKQIELSMKNENKKKSKKNFSKNNDNKKYTKKVFSTSNAPVTIYFD